MGGNSFKLDRLRAALKPFRLYWFARLRSTNDHAAELRKRSRLYAPAVVLTGHQTAGRGRGTNTWHSAAGSLTVTFALPIEEHLLPQQLSLVAGLAVRNAAAELTANPSIGLKWPNDIVHDGRKLAGLLCERIHRVDLVGLGLNVNTDVALAPAELRPRITSLNAIAGQNVDITDTLIAIARHLHRTLSRRKGHPFGALINEYGQHHTLIGRRVTVSNGNGRQPISGRCIGLDQLGRLLVQDRRTTHSIVSGHVELLD